MRRSILSLLAVGITMLAADLLWLGLVARELYDSNLGALRRETVYWPAALLFYTMYVAAIFLHAVRKTPGVAAAARRGAGLGLLAYATYELTNWAVIQDWPAVLVPIDILWGVALTASAAAAGRLALGSERP